MSEIFVVQHTSSQCHHLEIGFTVSTKPPWKPDIFKPYNYLKNTMLLIKNAWESQELCLM